MMIKFRITWPMAKGKEKASMSIIGRQELFIKDPLVNLFQSYTGSLCDCNNLITGVKVNLNDHTGKKVMSIDIENHPYGRENIEALDNGLTTTRYTKYVTQKSFIALLVES